MNLALIEERLVRAFTQAQGWLPPEQLADMTSLARAGEPGVALENFCTQLEEYDIAIPQSLALELKDIGAAMGMPMPRWIEERARAEAQ